ncbi:MAG: hypothetical protein J7K48_03885 [Thermococcus sp.]|nr:hypothetical protein [Thermococcus sp.]
MPDDEIIDEPVSTDEPTEEKPPEDEQKAEEPAEIAPPEVLEVMKSLIDKASSPTPLMPGPPSPPGEGGGKNDQDDDNDDSGKDSDDLPATDVLPPRRWWDWAVENLKELKDSRRKKLVRLVTKAYDEGLTLSELRKLGGWTRGKLDNYIDFINSLYEEHPEPYIDMPEDIETAGASTDLPMSPDVLKQPAKPPAEEKPKRKKGRPPKSDEEKVTNEAMKMSKATTTFKEIDKAIAESLGAQFHERAIREKTYSRLGELLIYTLLSLGAVDRDKIVAYSEQLVDDPDALYFYIKEQLDSVIKITDPETLRQVWMENAQLRMRVNALEATADMLAEALNYYGDVIRFLTGMLDKSQLEKFAAWIYMTEWFRKKKKAAKAGFSALGGGV